ncbi:MAG: cytochrome C [Deltaproteobacteria bacterium]|nr:cytochrome C [Deltaproteobacteria bacterium]
MIRLRSFPVVAVGVLVFSLAGPAGAFHSGGVAECEGCHTMHNSLEGAPMTPAFPQYQAGPYLLKGSDQGSVCLNCHQHAGDTGPSSYHVSTAPGDMPDGSPPLQLTPGGDFGWLKKTYTWTARAGAAPETSAGERHGHNIVAVDYGYGPDTTPTGAPGGGAPGIAGYPVPALSCTSCHDPHGKYRLNANNGAFSTGGKPIRGSGSYGAVPDATTAVGSYRLLAGAGYQPKSLPGSNAFVFAPPIAVAPDTYNRAEVDNGTSQVIVAYGKNMSLWCANCHAQMHTTFGTVVHPADQTMSSTASLGGGVGVATAYNAYRKSGNLGGSQATAYWSLVPFQHDNFVDLNQLKGFVGSTNGPTSGVDRVMCLSCHRAHASGFDSMTRFGVGNEFITVADATGDPLWPDPAANPAQAQGRTVAETQQAYYGRPATVFAPYQRALCNKCHAKD